MPADILRETDRPEATEPAQGSPPSALPMAPTFKDYAAKIMQMAPQAPSETEYREAKEKATQAREAAAKGASDFAAAQKPEIEATMKAGEKFAAEAAERKPQAPQLSAPPSRGLRPFLMAGKDETPEATISKLLAATTAFAGMIGGGKAGARASLSAMTGALEGWHAGDKERADRAFKDWKAHTETMLEQWNTELQDYELWMKASGMPLEQRMRGLQLQAMNFGNEQLAAKLTSDNANAGFKEIQDRQAAAVGLQMEVAKLTGMHENAETRAENAYNLAVLKGDMQMELTKLRFDQKEKSDKAAVDAYDPESLKAMGQQWALTGKMPSIGQGGKGAAVQIRGKVIRAGLDWAKEQGIDPSSLPSVQAEVAAAKAAVIDLGKKNAVQEAAIRRLDGHLDKWVELSDKVPRSEMPAVNGAILRGERDYAGSPDAALYVFQAFEVGMELSRVVVGSAQGDQATREHARQQMSAALNKKQVQDIAGLLRSNAHRNIESNKTSLKSSMEVLERVGAGSGAPKGEAATKTMTLPDGTTVTVK